MTYFVIKAAISGLLVALISELSRRAPSLGALIAALPLVSILAMIWLWRDTGDTTRIAALAQSTFWLVLPSLPLFLILPALLRGGTGFWPALGIGCAVTVVLYLLMLRLAARLGVAP